MVTSYILAIVNMNKNLFFDVMAALQLGGYSDDVVLYNFKNTDVQTEFGKNWCMVSRDGSCLNGRTISVYCKTYLEMLEMFVFLEREARFDRFADGSKYEILAHEYTADVIVLLYL